MIHSPDIGNLHVIDWYLWRDMHRSILPFAPMPAVPAYVCRTIRELIAQDFDIITEQREGWCYHDDL